MDKVDPNMVALFLILACFTTVSYGCQGRTCGECITSGENCAWCSGPGFDSPNDRCNTFNIINATCASENITYPDNNLTFTENKDVTDGTNGLDSIQIQPQKVNIKIKPKSKVTIPLTFQAARHYPVDLYFLFDLSRTMQGHKKKLANLAGEIAENIGKISNNYRLGFGYFQDKVILPYTNTLPAMLKNPCLSAGSDTRCSPPFGYRHRQNFTRNVTAFVQSVRTADVTGNIDSPEGGLDAIMQAVTCGEKIGWREGRKLLIYSSDSSFHTAGDGRLAGISKPNDGRCHLDNEGKNPEELNQDYPSVGQIAHSVSENNVNIIFAIAKAQERIYYDQLKERIEGSSVDVLEKDSNNVVEIVRTKYEALISEVTMKAESPAGVSVEFMSTCRSKHKKKIVNKCTGLTIGSPVEFDVDITVDECPTDPAERTQTVIISALNLPEIMNVTLELICECDCEKQGVGEANSARCSGGQGTYQCGVCDCNEGRSGKNCECNSTSASTETTQCQGFNTTAECSGRGLCMCGLCECDRGYSGQFCECHDNSCPTFNGLVCGGQARGRCHCGTCVCNAGFNDTSCQCALSSDECIDENGVLCSGVGSCQCGACSCSEGYIGKYCDICPACKSVCAENADCAECFAFGTGDLTKSECDSKCGHVRVVELIEDKEVCRLKDADGCIIKFRVNYYGEGNTTLDVQGERECPKKVDLLPIIAGVIGGILAVGILLLLLWKLLTSIYDGIEYSRFNEEVTNPKWGQVRNPIFREPTTTFNNPNFEKSETVD